MECSSGRVTTALSVHGTTVIQSGGLLVNNIRPCPIKYKSMKVQHPQGQHGRRQTVTEFIKEGEVNLKHGEQCYLSDLAVTSDNKLLLCN
jgi:hypothetical protein